MRNGRIDTVCVLPGDNPYELMRIYSHEYENGCTDELCPHCDHEVSIPIYGISPCPECGARILPCSMCADVYEDGEILQTCYRPCPYVRFSPKKEDA